MVSAEGVLCLTDLSKEAYRFEDLLEIMRRLRAPGGCPWDAEQTLDSLRRYILEESHELVEAIEDEDLLHICEESGDVLLQVVFIATIAKEKNFFEIDDVVRGICRKLVTRHPHVFGDVSVEDISEVSRNWERIKAAERKGRASDSSAMAGIPRSLPALLRAYRIQERAAKKGFDWGFGDLNPVREKVLEELDEFKAEVEGMNGAAAEEELGDLFFALVNLSRHMGIDPENALQAANAKFDARFRDVESLAQENGRNMEEMSLEELDALWVKAKESAKNKGRKSYVGNR